jgi:type I restriction enzyme M protein
MTDKTEQPSLTEAILNSEEKLNNNRMNTASDYNGDGMSLQELDSKLFTCADVLRGNVSKEKYKNYISPLLFLYAFETKYAQLSDEHQDMPDDQREQLIEDELGYNLPQDPSLSEISNETNDIAGTLDEWFRQFEKDNNTDLLDKDYSDEESLTDEVLQELIEKITEIDFENTPPDLLGEAYMDLMKRFAHEEGGEYFTPPKYSHLLSRTLYALDDGFEKGATFHDPTSGSSGLLIEAASLLRDDPKNRQEDTYKSLADSLTNHQFTGQELDPQIHKLGIMNAALHGMSGGNIEFQREDSLGNPQFTEDGKLAKFNYVLANPPFSQSWPKDKFKDGDKYNRFDWHEKLPRKNRADYAFLMHMLAHVEEDGMVASVVPHGVLYRSGEQRYRDYLLENDYVEAVISLPGKLFESTSAPTAILILNKDKPEAHEDEVLFVNADVEDRFYYDTGSSRNELLDDGVNEICEILSEWKTEERISRAVSTDEIEEFDNNLTLSLYVDTTEPQPEIDLEDVQRKHDELLDECVQLNEQIKTQIGELEL